VTGFASAFVAGAPHTLDSFSVTVESAMESLEIRYPVHDLICSRWSPVAFSPKPVEPGKLRSLFEAARWAPSSFNEQPWRFIVATRDSNAEFERLLNCLIPGNIEWAQNAPVLVFSIAKSHFTRDGTPNRHAFHDVGLAVGNLILQATALGLSVHQMAGFDAERARQTFGLPDGYEPVGGIALGYAAGVETLPERLRKRQQSPRIRKPLEEIIFGCGWGQVSSLVGINAEASPEDDLCPRTVGGTDVPEPSGRQID
jgi:nitroreductase